MDDPCKTCLIKVCCTDLCNEKFKYTDAILYALYQMGKTYIYNPDGFRNENISEKTKSKYDELVSECDRNNRETNGIFNRHVDNRVQ